ncbi:MAG: hypothetical protein GY773_12385 [Actinomycetia bacterium]|nr:hypothetical protein [Actinomycetes bacterium]
MRLTVSPDGAHVAVAVRDGVLLLSTDDGERVRLDLAGRLSPGLLFGPTSDETETVDS